MKYCLRCKSTEIYELESNSHKLNLKKFLSLKGLRQVQVARDINVTIAQLNKFLNGWEQLPDKHEQKFFEYLKISQEEYKQLKGETFNG